MADVKKWYLSKTLWAGVAAVVLSVVQYLTGVLDSILTGGTPALVTAGLGVLMIVLRAMTSQAIVAPKVPPASTLLVLALPLLVAGCTGLTTEQRGVLTGVGRIVAKTGTGFAAVKGQTWCLQQYERNKDEALLKLCTDLVELARTAADYGVKKGLESIPATMSAPCPIPEPAPATP